MKNTDRSSLIVKSVSMKNIDHISLSGLSKEQIEKRKEQLIKQHVNKAIEGLEYTNNSKSKKMCESRLFFVEKDNMLFLCGLYKVSERFYKIGPTTKRYSQVCDYLLYSEKCGFYYIIGCSVPYIYDDSLNTSPAIYSQSYINGTYILLHYGDTYQHHALNSLQIKYNTRKYSPEDKMYYYLAAIIDDSIVHEVKKATLYAELPMIPNYYVYTTDKDHISWLVFSYLYDFKNKRKCLVFSGRISSKF